MHRFKVVKLPNVSESASPIFYKRKRYTNVLFNKMFFQKMGVGPEGSRKRKALTPIFLEKHFVEKNICVPLAFVKNGAGAF